jgi:hypothetical protein
MGRVWQTIVRGWQRPTCTGHGDCPRPANHHPACLARYRLDSEFVAGDRVSDAILLRRRILISSFLATLEDERTSGVDDVESTG